jgi:hypothetical protein
MDELIVAHGHWACTLYLRQRRFEMTIVDEAEQLTELPPADEPPFRADRRRSSASAGGADFRTREVHV